MCLELLAAQALDYLLLSRTFPDKLAMTCDGTVNSSFNLGNLWLLETDGFVRLRGPARPSLRAEGRHVVLDLPTRRVRLRVARPLAWEDAAVNFVNDFLEVLIGLVSHLAPRRQDLLVLDRVTSAHCDVLAKEKLVDSDLVLACLGQLSSCSLLPLRDSEVRIVVALRLASELVLPLFLSLALRNDACPFRRLDCQLLPIHPSDSNKYLLIQYFAA